MVNYTSIMMNASKNDDFGNKESGASSETIAIIICVLNVPLMLLSIIGNSLVLAVILRTPSLRSASAVFLCNLAISDLLVGLVVQPVYIANEFTSSVSPLNHAENSLSVLACGVSLVTMTALSVDRCLALHCHMRYPNLMTQKRALHTTFFSSSFFPFCLDFIFGAATILFCYCRLHCLLSQFTHVHVKTHRFA